MITRQRQPWQGRFWKYAVPGALDECWEWKGCYDQKRYGVLEALDADGKPHREYAHRLSWRLHHGPIPDGLCVLHHCDNPPCVNPAHLFLGTVADNQHDMCAKGRQARGERNGRARLSEAAVLAVRRRHAAGGVTQKELGHEYGVHRVTIGYAVTGVSWKHLS